MYQFSNETYDTLKNGIQRLIELGQKDFLMVHPLVITFNATMGQPWYIKKYGLETVDVPLDTFYLSVEELEDYIVERTLAVVGTNTTTRDIVVKGNLFSHLLIVFYYYGWGHYLLEYIFNKYGIKHIDIVEEMFEYFENKQDSIIGEEIRESENSLRGVFERGEFWGRQVLGDDDIFGNTKEQHQLYFHKIEISHKQN